MITTDAGKIEFPKIKKEIKMKTNRKIIVDNATLSGVERMMGVSKVINLNNTSNDILCLEKLISAILFSDELIGVDDYKDEYRSARLKNFDFIKFLKLDGDTYSKISSDAAEFARSMTFNFEGAKPAGDVVKFFEALRVDPQLRWDIFVSSEYLTLSFLVKDHRAKNYEEGIDSIFRNENTDSGLVASPNNFGPSFGVRGRSEIEDIKSLVQSFKSENHNFAGVDGKSALERMVFGYGWAAERSYFYNAVAEIEESDAYLAPLRDAFCESCLRLDFPSQVAALLNNLADKTQKTLATILEPTGQAKFIMRLPFFTAYLITKTNNPKECIEHALELRSRSEFQDCRTIFNNLTHYSAPDRVKELNSAFAYLEQSCDKLLRSYSISTSNGPQITASVGISGPSISTKLNGLFRTYKNRPVSRVFRNIAQDMLNVERLGGLYEKICSSIVEHPDANYPKISATPKFMEKRENEYGRPATLAPK